MSNYFCSNKPKMIFNFSTSIKFLFLILIINVFTIQNQKSDEDKIMNVIDNWFVCFENGQTRMMKNLINCEHNKLSDNEIIEKIELLAGFYIKSLWINEKKLKVSNLKYKTEVIKFTKNQAIVKVEYSYCISWFEDFSKTEFIRDIEFINMKKKYTNWYIENSFKNNKNLK